MAHRKEVFQSKVLQKLYPTTLEQVKEQSPSHTVEALAKKKHVKRKAPGEDTASGEAVKRQSAASPGRRLYTVLPPPADYDMPSEGSVSLPQLKSINSVEEPAEEHIHESDEELDGEQEAEEQKRRRRRRKKKATFHQDSGNDEATPRSESGAGQSQTPVDEGAERISRNKKRKLKKKRHKQKLLSMGLMPRATALEFTYQNDGEEEDDSRRAAEVSDFLRTTMEIFLSDSSLRAATAPHLSATVDDLLGSIDRGCRPDSVLRQLYTLKTFVQQIDTDKLEEALKELSSSSSSCMSAEETAAVVTLFQYWITDILPVQGDEETALSAAHP
ncbi:glutamate-rich protein 1 isoform X2 [Archocentrus centrarchus]|uniref:glutamate-rich protein 1 isoform X2 n=1 Tax=Archocentrus centrarchus TaxID=63155 RepID=UPI0011EA03AF|nr:glutamate-rich protein 1 isoform X2 [Archocentrus centrarchus]